MNKNVTRKSKKCENCGQEFQPSSNRQVVCKPCRKDLDKTKGRERHKRRYKRKGYNQKGKNNNNWKGGIRFSYYCDIAFSSYPNECNRCKSKDNLLVHHIDENRRNNEPSNLEILCKVCHQAHHVKRDILGRFTPPKKV